MNKPHPLIGVDIDKEIVQDMSSSEESRHYRRYITDRFEVVDISEGEHLCAIIADHETGKRQKMHEGDSLADGSIQVIEEGVVYRPPRADVEPFLLRNADEMSPLMNHTATRKRGDMNEILEQEHRMSSIGDEDDKMIIVLSTEPMY